MLALLSLPAALVLPLTTLGIDSGVLYLISTSRFRVGEAVSTVLALALGQGIAAALLSLALWEAGVLGSADYTSRASATVLFLAIANLPLLQASLLATNLLYGAADFTAANTVSACASVVRTVGLVYLTLVGALTLETVLTMGLVTNAGAVAALVALVLTRHQPVHLRPSWRLVGTAAGFGGRAWLGQLSSRANLRLDQLVLSHYVPAPALGVYSVATVMAEALLALPDAVGVVLFKRIASCANQPLRQSYLERVHRLVFWATFLIGLLLSVAVLFGTGALLGREYEDLPNVVVLLVPAIAMLASLKVQTKYTSAIGRPGLGSIGVTLGAILGSVVLLVAVPRWGIYGAALASVAGYASAALLMAAFYSNWRARVAVGLFAFAVRDYRGLHDLMTDSTNSRA